MKNTMLLIRKRINTILSDMYNYPLTIVEAPIGFGKTTAVKNFLKTEDVHYLWITFSEHCNNTALFWEGFSNEISNVDKQSGSALSSLGFTFDAPQIGKVVQILNNIEFKNKLIIVLDDFHLSDNSQIQKLILKLASEELDGLHFLLITRDTNNINYIELLFKGLCLLISQHNLKFTDNEIYDYCKMMFPEIAESDLNQICSYTDGWISFIYLIVLGLENGIPVGMNITIEELIEKALLHNYDQYIQKFLFKLSLMDDFTAKQVEFVFEDKNAEVILRKLNKENAFVFFDKKKKIYKIHNVLLDFLRLHQNFEPEELYKLYSRLGEWHLKLQDFKTAYSYFSKAGLKERILTHLNDPKNVRDELVIFEDADKVFDSINKELLFKYPIAYLQYIFCSIVTGKQNAVMSWNDRLEEIKHYFKNIDCIDEDYKNRIMGETLIVQKFTQFNHMDKIKASDSEIKRLLNNQQSYLAIQGNEFTFGSPHYLYIYFRDEGGLKKLVELVSNNFEYSKFANGCGTGSDLLALAEYALETGDWGNAHFNSQKAIFKAQTKNQISVIICAKFNLIRFLLFQGKVSEAIEMLKQMELDIKNVNNAIYNTSIDMCKGYIYSCLSQIEKIPLWLQTGDISAADFLYQGIAFNYLVYGKAVLAAKKYAELEILTESFEKSFSQFNNQLGFIHNYIFKAAAAYNLYGTEAGVSALLKALYKAQSDWIIMPFAENAQHILEIMKIISKNYSDNKYFQEVYLCCCQYAQNIKDIIYSPIHLSQREHEIISLTAKGLTRKEIAVRLNISDGTVKTHLKNIYLKLEANGKLSAIKIAQARGYIS